eukprot:COSAG05_NODE_14_length_36349_cov_27.641655_14_plen_46_part_00
MSKHVESMHEEWVQSVSYVAMDEPTRSVIDIDIENIVYSYEIRKR